MNGSQAEKAGNYRLRADQAIREANGAWPWLMQAQEQFTHTLTFILVNAIEVTVSYISLCQLIQPINPICVLVWIYMCGLAEENLFLKSENIVLVWTINKVASLIAMYGTLNVKLL